MGGRGLSAGGACSKSGGCSGSWGATAWRARGGGWGEGGGGGAARARGVLGGLPAAGLRGAGVRRRGAADGGAAWRREGSAGVSGGAREQMGKGRRCSRQAGASCTPLAPQLQERVGGPLQGEGPSPSRVLRWAGGGSWTPPGREWGGEEAGRAG